MRLLVHRADIGEERRIETRTRAELDARLIGTVAETLLRLDLAADIVAILQLAFAELQPEFSAANGDLLFRPGAVLMASVVPAIGEIPDLRVERVEVLDERRSLGRILGSGGQWQDEKPGKHAETE